MYYVKKVKHLPEGLNQRSLNFKSQDIFKRTLFTNVVIELRTFYNTQPVAHLVLHKLEPYNCSRSNPP